MSVGTVALCTVMMLGVCGHSTILESLPQFVQTVRYCFPKYLLASKPLSKEKHKSQHLICRKTAYKIIKI